MLEHFNKIKPSNMPMANIYSRLSDESAKDSINTSTHLCIIIHLFLSNGFNDSFLKTMWYHTHGCKNNYLCKSFVYLQSCIALEFCITIWIEVGESGHGKYIIYGLNDRYKWILKLSMENY